MGVTSLFSQTFAAVLAEAKLQQSDKNTQPKKTIVTLNPAISVATVRLQLIEQRPISACRQMM